MGRRTRELAITILLLCSVAGDYAERVLDSDAFAAYVLVIGMAVGGLLIGYAIAA